MIKVLCFIFISVFFTNAFSAQKFEKILKVDDSGALYFYVGNMFERKKNVPEYVHFLTRIEFDFSNLTASCTDDESKLQAKPIQSLNPKSRDILKGVIDKKTNTITEISVVESFLSPYAASEEHGEEYNNIFNCKKFFTSKSMFDRSHVQGYITASVANICTSLPKLTSCLKRVNKKMNK